MCVIRLPGVMVSPLDLLGRRELTSVTVLSSHFVYIL